MTAPQSLPIPATTRRTIRLLALSRALALAGFEAAFISLMALLYSQTGSAAHVSGAFAVFIGAAAVAAPVAGWLGDHVDRRRLMVVSELGHAACFLAVPVATSDVALIALLAAAAVLGAPFAPALNAAIPVLVHEEHLGWANARVATARTAGHLGGPLLGGLLVASVGAHPAFLVTGVLLVCSAMLVAFVRGPMQKERVHELRDRSLLAGLTYVWHDRVLRRIVGAWFAVSLGFGLIVAAELPLALEFDVGEVGYGAIASSWAVGALAGGLVAHRVALRLEAGSVLMATTAILGAALAAVALTPWFAGVLAGMVVGGLAMAVAGVVDTTLVQQRAPEGVRSRVLAANELVLLVSFGVSLPLGGYVVDATSAQAAYAAASALDLLAIVMFARAAKAIASERAARRTGHTAPTRPGPQLGAESAEMSTFPASPAQPAPEHAR